MSVVPDLVAKVGLWWPDADPDTLRAAAAHWDTFGDSLRQVIKQGDLAASSLASDTSGEAIEAFRSLWGAYSGAGGYLAQTAEHAHIQAGMLRDYRAHCEQARSQIIEIAVTIAASVALSFVTFGVSGAAGAGAVAALIANAARIGITLSRTVAMIIVGAAEALVIDLAVAQPIRIYGFDHGGWSLTEAVVSVAGGGLGGAAAAKYQAWRAAGGGWASTKNSFALRMADETGAIRIGRYIDPALNRLTQDGGRALERDRILKILAAGGKRSTTLPPAPATATPIASLEGSGRRWVESNWGDIHYRFVSSGGRQQRGIIYLFNNDEHLLLNVTNGGPGGITRYYRNIYQPYEQWTPEMKRTLMQEIHWSPELAEKFPRLWLMHTL